MEAKRHKSRTERDACRRERRNAHQATAKSDDHCCGIYGQSQAEGEDHGILEEMGQKSRHVDTSPDSPHAKRPIPGAFFLRGSVGRETKRSENAFRLEPAFAGW